MITDFPDKDNDEYLYTHCFTRLGNILRILEIIIIF